MSLFLCVRLILFWDCCRVDRPGRSTISQRLLSHAVDDLQVVTLPLSLSCLLWALQALLLLSCLLLPPATAACHVATPRDCLGGRHTLVCPMEPPPAMEQCGPPSLTAARHCSIAGCAPPTVNRLMDSRYCLARTPWRRRSLCSLFRWAWGRKETISPQP